MKYDVIIIGAGNGGLAAAAYLSQQGCKILLLEKDTKINMETICHLLLLRLMKGI